VRRAETGDPSAGLGECDRIARVGVHHGTDAIECLEEPAVRRGIG
jgi:hypothetical protein